MFSVFVKMDGEWKKLAWDLSVKEAQSLVLSCVTMHGVLAEYRPQ